MFRRWWARLGLLGMLVSLVITMYAGSVAFLNPLNRSSFDRTWAFFYGALLASIALLCWFWRGRLLIGVTLFAMAGIVVTIIVRAGTGPALGVWLWLMLIAAGLGNRVLKLIAPSVGAGAFERLILGISLGFGGLALLTLLLAALHLLYPVVAYGLLIGLTALVSPALVRSFGPTLGRWVEQVGEAWRTADLRLHAVVLSSSAVCLLGAFLWAVSPSIHYDALMYHLGVPALYVQQHGLLEVTEEFRSYWAHNAEMLYTLGLLLVGQPLPTLVHLTSGLLATGLVFCLGRRLGGVRVGLFAALLFYSIPIVTWESGTAFIDLIVSLYVFGAVYSVIAWWQEENDAWLIIAGLLTGFGLGTKLNAILVIFPYSLFLVGGLLLRYRPSRRSLMGLLCFCIPALLLFAPWLLRDWLWTGNPLFPFFNAIFQSAKWSHENTMFNFATFGQGHGVVDFLRLPWDLIIHASAFAEAAPLGVVGGLPLLALPWLYPWYPARMRRLLPAVFAFALGVIITWFVIGQYARYLLPLFPLLATLAALNVWALWLRFLRHAWRKQLAVLGLIVALSYVGATRLVHMVWGWNIPERYPYRVALGLESPQAFLSRALPVYDALQFLNQQGEDKPQVLSIGNEFRMYTTAQVLGMNASREAGLIASSLPPGPNLAATLKRQGYDFLLVNQNETTARPDMYQLSVLEESFLRQFARLEFARHNVYVYRLIPDGSEGTFVESRNLLTNSGFEETDAQGTLPGWFAYGSPVVDRTGTRSHSGQVAVQANGQAGLYQRIAVEPGRLYTLGHWTRADRANQFARLQINWLDNSLRIVDVSIDVVPTDATWQWHQMSVTTPNGAALAQVYVSVHENSEVWFDDFELVEGETHGQP